MAQTKSIKFGGSYVFVKISTNGDKYFCEYSQEKNAASPNFLRQAFGSGETAEAAILDYRREANRLFAIGV